ncbi:hypothetical protein ACS0TY_010118 [Phlomoides rotata]
MADNLLNTRGPIIRQDSDSDSGNEELGDSTHRGPKTRAGDSKHSHDDVTGSLERLDIEEVSRRNTAIEKHQNTRDDIVEQALTVHNKSGKGVNNIFAFNSAANMGENSDRDRDQAYSTSASNNTKRGGSIQKGRTRKIIKVKERIQNVETGGSQAMKRARNWDFGLEASDNNPEDLMAVVGSALHRPEP